MKPWGPAIFLLLTAAGLGGFFAARSLATKPEQRVDAELAQTPHAVSATKDQVPFNAPLASQQRSALGLYPLFIGSSRDIAIRAMTSTVNLPAYVAIPQIAQAFFRRPYNAFSLDNTRQEELRIDLTSFDCFLFVEQLIALVNSHDISGFVKTVRDLRYEEGRVNYCSRYHYFTHWADNAISKGLMLNLAGSLPQAVNRSIRLDYMSSHGSAYAPMRLKSNSDCIVKKESSLVANQAFVPIDSLLAVENQIRSGDVFALVTGVQGLDVTHVGFLLKEPKRLSAIHAAPGRGVMISPDFVSYASSVPEVIGVAIYRPLTQNLNP
jgi:hypothetical protein